MGKPRNVIIRSVIEVATKCVSLSSRSKSTTNLTWSHFQEKTTKKISNFTLFENFNPSDKCVTCCKDANNPSQCESCSTNECESDCSCKDDDIPFWYYIGLLCLLVLVIGLLFVVIRNCKKQPSTDDPNF